MRSFIRRPVFFVVALVMFFMFCQSTYCTHGLAGAAEQYSPAKEIGSGEVVPVIDTPVQPQLEAPKWQPLPSMTTGGLLVLTVPDPSLFGGYVFFGPSLLLPVKGVFSLVTVLNIEVAPGLGNWGFVSIVLADFNLAPWLSLDIGPIFAHDWDPLLQQQREQGHTAYIGVTAGPTFLLPQGLTVSVSATILGNVEGLGWLFNPTVTFGVPLPLPPTPTVDGS